jgi:hypothetical protein
MPQDIMRYVTSEHTVCVWVTTIATTDTYRMQENGVERKIEWVA